MIDSIFVSSALGLIFLFLLSEITGSVFKIYRNSFYSYFHFVGGGITFLFWYSLIQIKMVCLFLTLATGIVWEIYEWVRWKYFIKEKKKKPQRGDTATDIILDVVGGILITVLFSFI